jgi:hypothetical protein
MKAFEEALGPEENLTELEEGTTPTAGDHGHNPRRVRKVSALSDFAPINQRVTRCVISPRTCKLVFQPHLIISRRRKRSPRQDRRTEWTYVLIRWPLLVSKKASDSEYLALTAPVQLIIFSLIAFEFNFYILIRQLVNTKEWISACKSKHFLS